MKEKSYKKWINETLDECFCPDECTMWRSFMSTAGEIQRGSEAEDSEQFVPSAAGDHGDTAGQTAVWAAERGTAHDATFVINKTTYFRLKA